MVMVRQSLSLPLLLKTGTFVSRQSSNFHSLFTCSSHGHSLMSYFPLSSLLEKKNEYVFSMFDRITFNVHMIRAWSFLFHSPLSLNENSGNSPFLFTWSQFNLGFQRKIMGFECGMVDKDKKKF